jgi:hypothetical protein
MTAYTIVGQQHLNTRAQRDRWHALKPGDPLTLEREPTNEHDPNAIVVLSNGLKVGYIRAKEAKLLAPWWDQHGQHAAVVYEKPNSAKVTVRAKPADEPAIEPGRHGDDPGASS